MHRASPSSLACDGERAMSMLADAQFKPNLIILDLNTPKVSGLGLLERGDMTGIPAVVFTSSSNPAEKERCLALGVRELVLKPMDLGEVRRNSLQDRAEMGGSRGSV